MTAPASRIRRAPAAGSTVGAKSRVVRWAGAAPALLTIVGVLLFILTVATQRYGPIRDRYFQEAGASLARSDFKTARLCYERLLQQEGRNPVLLFGLAQSLEGLGQSVEASQILRRIAPADAAGYAPAHVLIAERLLSSAQTPEAVALAEKHLRRALESDPGNAEAQTVLSTIHPAPAR